MFNIKLPKIIEIYIQDYVNEHKNSIDFFLDKKNWYFLDKIFFKDLLSWKFQEFIVTDLEKFNFSEKEWISELVPVFYFKKKNKNISWIFLELHKNSNPF